MARGKYPGKHDATALTATLEARLFIKSIAAHLDKPMWEVMELAARDMHAKFGLPMPLALQKSDDAKE